MAFALAARRLPEKEATRLSKQLVALMVKRGSANLLPRVLAALPKAMVDADAASRVTVESSRELPPKTVTAVLEAIGMDVDPADIVRTISPGLIGGVRVRSRDRVVDLTIRGRIEKLKGIGQKMS